MDILKSKKMSRILRILALVLLCLCVAAFVLTSNFVSWKSAVLWSLCPLVWLVMIAGLARGDYGRVSVYMLGLVIVAWFVVSRFLQDKGFTADSTAYFSEMCILYGLAFPFARLADDSRRRVCDALCAVLVLGMTVVAWAGVYATLSGTTVSVFGGRFACYIDPDDSRLYAMGLNANTVGTSFALAILAAVYLAVRHRRTGLRIAAAVCVVSLFWALALTGSRTAQGSLLVCLVPMLAAGAGKAMKGKKLRVIVMIAAALIGVFVTYKCLGLTQDFLLEHRCAPTAETVQTAEPAAEEQTAVPAVAEQTPEQTAEVPIAALSRRELISDFLTGRDITWLSTLHYMRDHPGVLLTGSPESRIPMMSFYEQDSWRMKLHVHNSFLQTLALLGIPGLLMVLALCAVLAVYALKILFSPKTGLADKLLPLPLLALIVNVQMESYLFVPYTSLADSAFIDLFFFLAAGYTVELGRKLKITEERL